MRNVATILAAALALAGCVSTTEAESAAPASGSATLRIGGQEARLGSLGVRALRLEEDSRCPSGVQCVWAGRVRVAVRLREGETVRDAILGSDRPEPLAGGRFLRLVATCPARQQGTPPSPAAYSFLIATGSETSDTPPVRRCDPG